jgi:hypothetical protein
MRKKLILTLLLAFLVAACATTQEVRTIVREANAASLLAASEFVTAHPAKPAVGGGDVIDRIDAFLDQHPEPQLARVCDALRVRKGLLLAARKRSNLARETFAQVQVANLGNPRDRAIYRASGALIWWWTVAARENVPPATFRADAAQHGKTLDKEIGEAPAGSAIRYYLATLRAHVFLKWSSMGPDPRGKLFEGLTAYAKEFDDGAQKYVAAFAKDKTPPPENLRWYGQALVTAKAYDDAYRAWLTEVRDANPEDLDPAIRAELGSLETDPDADPPWPDACKWLVALLR